MSRHILRRHILRRHILTKASQSWRSNARWLHVPLLEACWKHTMPGPHAGITNMLSKSSSQTGDLTFRTCIRRLCFELHIYRPASLMVRIFSTHFRVKHMYREGLSRLCPESHIYRKAWVYRSPAYHVLNRWLSRQILLSQILLCV